MTPASQHGGDAEFAALSVGPAAGQNAVDPEGASACRPSSEPLAWLPGVAPQPAGP